MEQNVTAAFAIVGVVAAAVAVWKAYQAREALRQLKAEMDGFIERLRRK